MPLTLQCEERDGVRVLVLLGELDDCSAGAVRDGLIDAPAGQRLAVDLTRLARRSDRGLGVLAGSIAALRDRGRRVSLLGLRHHERLLLRYLGLPEEPPPPGEAELP